MPIVGPPSGGGGGPPIGAAGGVLAGEYPNPILAALEWKLVETINASLHEVAGFTPWKCAVLGGVIFLAGMFEVAVEIPAKTKLGLLPVGARPEHEQTIQVSTTASGTQAVILKVNGEIITESILKITAGKLSLAGFAIGIKA